MTFQSYEELEEFLRSWRNWHGEGDYDFTGMVHLLAACLGNLNEHALEADLEDLAEHLDESQVQTLRRLAGYLEA